MASGVQNDAQWLDTYRSYLHLLARLELSPQYAAKVDLSGVVQQTLFEAHAAGNQLKQLDEERRAAMLRKILANNMKDEIRKFNTAARDVARDQSLHTRLDQSSQRLENFLAEKQSSPSHVVSRNEQAIRLASALATLPEHQRTAVELHHLRGMKLVEVGRANGSQQGRRCRTRGPWDQEASRGTQEHGELEKPMSKQFNSFITSTYRHCLVRPVVAAKPRHRAATPHPRRSHLRVLRS